eukprot:9712915-Heterocapsa_arctica.AAC.1
MPSAASPSMASRNPAAISWYLASCCRAGMLALAMRLRAIARSLDLVTRRATRRCLRGRESMSGGTQLRPAG